MSSQWEALSDVIPIDNAVQFHSSRYLEEVGRGLPDGAIVLDLGCGTGRSRKVVRRIKPTLRWVGVDLPSSPEVDKRRPDRAAALVAFDGVRLPFRASSIDCVYSHQVLEHVRHPEPQLREVVRVLRPGAPFIGSTSHLEPYHSRSFWNFTPYGFRTIAEDAGLVVEELRAGIDGITLIERQLKGRSPKMSRFFLETSPVNRDIIAWGKRRRRRAALVNNRMLQFSGHFAFRTVRPRG